MPDRLEKTVAEFIRRRGLFAGAGRILLAVSGGADSTALLHVLAALRARGQIAAELAVAHINHQLRGAASDADERFVVEQADRLGLPAITRAMDVRAHARTQGLSLETAARQLRLAALCAIAREQGCRWVGTGHQKNDNAETVLHRLCRGTGLRGLAGIRPARRFGEVWLASPLLGATRREIVQYLEAHALGWREDRTNVDLAHTRNYLRHRLLPELQRQAQGDLVEELSELAASAGRLYERVEREASEAWPRLAASAEGEVTLQASGLAALPEPVAVELIRRAVADLADGGIELAQAHYRGILDLARRGVSGKALSLPNGFAARREGERIALSAGRRARGPVPPGPASATLAVPGKTQFGDWEMEAAILPRDGIEPAGLKGDKGPAVEYLDFDRVALPAVVRAHRPGDRFQPLGLAAEKRVGKFLTAARTPRSVREQILIVADRTGIVWVCPVRLSERVKITDGTRCVLRLAVRRR